MPIPVGNAISRPTAAGRANGSGSPPIHAVGDWFAPVTTRAPKPAVPPHGSVRSPATVEKSASPRIGAFASPVCAAV